jgi:hypothetical protein
MYLFPAHGGAAAIQRVGLALNRRIAGLSFDSPLWLLLTRRYGKAAIQAN